MTREMKIGLLLSLGIVIVVCVLLSDQVVSTTDPRPASVTNVAPQANAAIVTPGGASESMGGLVKVNDDVEPTQTVATCDEMTPKMAGVANISVGPGNLANNNQPTNTQAIVQAPVTSGPVAPGPMVAGLEKPVEQLLVAVPPAAPKSQEYKAVAGDTVAKMARKFYGSDTKANCELIISANKASLKDPGKIVVGKSYTIPAKPAATSVKPAAVTVAVGPATRPAESNKTLMMGPIPAKPETPAAAERFYVVKSGDNLWKIAKEQCKNANAVDEIKKLNHDQLKGGADLKVGMKLRLPVM